MKKVLILVFAILVLTPFEVNSQNQNTQLFFYNVAFGAITSAVGSTINKQKGEKWSKKFLNGLWQGGAGGALNFSGKWTLSLLSDKQSLAYAWPSRILHSAGTSIIESAALNKPFLQDWSIDVGIVRLNFSTAESNPMRVRFLPQGGIAIVRALIDKGTFDLKSSLLTRRTVPFARSSIG